MRMFMLGGNTNSERKIVGGKKNKIKYKQTNKTKPNKHVTHKC
jgi:hypothetical protein